MRVIGVIFVTLGGLMAKRGESSEEKPKKLSTYTIKLDEVQMDKLRALCVARQWEAFEVPYARFAFRGTDVNVTAYDKRKVVVIAGKGTEEFVTMTLEPEITMAAKLGYDEILHPDWFEAHAGLDESGKGDFFGPVVAATVIADKAMIDAWREAGVQDSKKIVDTQIIRLDAIIRETKGVVVEVCYCRTMARYNELMGRPGANLNRFLAWQHATALGDALAKRSVPWGLLDQFTEQPLVQRELAKKGVQNFELRMRTKAESDPVVAAASVVARAEFIRAMHALSKQFGEKLQKGAGPLVKIQADQIMQKFGTRALGDYAKLHFRTAYEVVAAAGKLDELPLKPPPPKMEW
ncbi:MAG: ribonuclease HIII [Opitutaceae bacterium]